MRERIVVIIYCILSVGVSRVGDGGGGEWICIFRSGATRGSRDPHGDHLRTCYRCLEEFKDDQVGCTCGGIAADGGVTNVYERFITVDETRSCLVLGVDVKPVMADNYIAEYQQYVRDREIGGDYERIWAQVVGFLNGWCGTRGLYLGLPLVILI